MFGLYKSDWTAIGGFNVQQYTKWGGEDWDVLDRLVHVRQPIVEVDKRFLLKCEALWN